ALRGVVQTRVRILLDDAFFAHDQIRMAQSSNVGTGAMARRPRCAITQPCGGRPYEQGCVCNGDFSVDFWDNAWLASAGRAWLAIRTRATVTTCIWRCNNEAGPRGSRGRRRT